MHMPFAVVPPSVWVFVFAPAIVLFAGSFLALVVGSVALLRPVRAEAEAVDPGQANEAMTEVQPARAA